MHLGWDRSLTGTVLYFAAKMPQTTKTWTIPDRAPNVRIVSVEGELIANRGASGGEAIGLDATRRPIYLRRLLPLKIAGSIRILASILLALPGRW